MKCDWKNDLRLHSCTAVELFPPPMFAEAGWDILLALHAEPEGKLGLDRLSGVVSTTQGYVKAWLADLEERRLVTAEKHRETGKLCAVLTGEGRRLLDRYLTAMRALPLGN